MSLTLFACTPKTSPAQETSASAPKTLQPEALAIRGKKVYSQNCIACHNPDPKQAGAVGPAIAGSNLELITARVLHATYPPGYTPKRDSKLMPALPSLEPDLTSLHAFLNQ